MLVRSRNPSSIDIGTSVGVYASMIWNISLDNRRYSSYCGLASTPCGHMRLASKQAMPVWMPNRFASRLAAITMPSPRRPPPTHTARPDNEASSATSQLAKKVSPSTCKMRLGSLETIGEHVHFPRKTARCQRAPKLARRWDK